MPTPEHRVESLHDSVRNSGLSHPIVHSVNIASIVLIVHGGAVELSSGTTVAKFVALY